MIQTRSNSYSYSYSWNSQGGGGALPTQNWATASAVAGNGGAFATAQAGGAGAFAEAGGGGAVAGAGGSEGPGFPPQGPPPHHHHHHHHKGGLGGLMGMAKSMLGGVESAVGMGGGNPLGAGLKFAGAALF